MIINGKDKTVKMNYGIMYITFLPHGCNYFFAGNYG